MTGDPDRPGEPGNRRSRIDARSLLERRRRRPRHDHEVRADPRNRDRPDRLGRTCRLLEAPREVRDPLLVGRQAVERLGVRNRRPPLLQRLQAPGQLGLREVREQPGDRLLPDERDHAVGQRKPPAKPNRIASPRSARRAASGRRPPKPPRCRRWIADGGSAVAEARATLGLGVGPSSGRGGASFTPSKLPLDPIAATTRSNRRRRPPPIPPPEARRGSFPGSPLPARRSTPGQISGVRTT